MPTYQYQCTECAEPLEAHQSFTDDALTVCPDCGGRLRKVFNAVGVVFKGSGFYRNDSRQTTNSGEPATSSGIESSAKDSGGKDSDAKVSASKDSGDHGSSKPTKSTESSTNSTPAKKTGSDSAA